MDINIKTAANLEVDFMKLQKMAFIYNAIESGWAVNKNEDKYVFNKKHEGKKEVFLDSYLQEFLKNNMTLEQLKVG